MILKESSSKYQFSSHLNLEKKLNLMYSQINDMHILNILQTVQDVLCLLRQVLQPDLSDSDAFTQTDTE